MPTPEEDAAAAAAAAAQPKWFDGADDETKGYITNRGLDKLTPADAALNTIKAHRAAEAKLGAPADKLVRLPKDAGDQEAWDKLYAAVGKPKAATDYDFTAAKGLDDEFAGLLREAAFQNHIPKAAAEALAGKFAEFAAKAETSSESEQAAKAALEQTELKKDWGFNFQANLLVAQRAAEALGVDPAAIQALEGKVGYKAVMQMMHKIGTKIGEDKFVTSQVTGSVMSIEGAKERIAALKGDSEWRTKYLAGGVAQQKEWNDLHRIAYGQGEAA